MIAQDLISELYFSVPRTVVVMFSTEVQSRLVSPDLITELYFSLASTVVVVFSTVVHNLITEL